MINVFSNEYAWLSNFYPCKITYEGEVYPSVENAYQAAKTIDPIARIPFTKCTAGTAKRQGRKLEIRPDWEVNKLRIMEELIYLKFKQSPFCLWLMDTEDEYIEEGNTWGDLYWGTCKGQGKNHLGKIIMKVRQQLAEEQYDY